MSISAGSKTFKDIGELEADDLIAVDSPAHPTQAPADNPTRVTIDYPIDTGDNEVFVITQAEFKHESVPMRKGAGYEPTIDSYVTYRCVASTAPESDPVTDEETAEKGLAVQNFWSFSDTNGNDSFESWDVRPTFHNPRVMPFGEGEYSLYVNDAGNVSVGGVRLHMQGYVTEVDDGTLTRYLRQLR